VGRKFFEDRARGKRVEHDVAFLLRTLTHHKSAQAVPPGLFPGFDIEDPCTGRRVEVKADWRAQTTDQFAVEHHFGPDPSGISTTAADDWAFWDGQECVLISVDALVDVIRAHGVHNEFTFKGPGDPVRKAVYGIKRWMIKEAATCVWSAAPYEITPPPSASSHPRPRSPGP
jgi:hypothetical protein